MPVPEEILIKSSSDPTVEIDTAAGAAYVRFKRSTRVARTVHLPRHDAIVTIDYDRGGDVIGLELLGVKEFSIRKLLKIADARTPNTDLSRTRYVGAGRELAAAG
jgi:Protein of unknown function (DUF2283).